MHIPIRRAMPADLPQLLQFEQGVILAERPFDPTIKPDPVHYYDLAAMISDANVDIVVAEHEGRIIGSGYARVEIAKPFADHSHYGYLGFMFVDPAYRGQGVNALVIDRLKELMRARGIGELRLEVYANNIAALRAYEKYGFTPLLLQMRLDSK